MFKLLLAFLIGGSLTVAIYYFHARIWLLNSIPILIGIIAIIIAIMGEKFAVCGR